MLQNAYLLAKIGADTAENERNFAENLPKIGNYLTGPLPYGPTPEVPPAPPGDPGGGLLREGVDLPRLRWEVGDVGEVGEV